jgi:GT2 family glycosyltransferase
MLETVKSRPFFSVLIVTWNRAELLESCLRSLDRQTWRDFEVVVVDNDSQDGTKELLAEQFVGKVKVVTNSANLGFAGGVNAGLRVAAGEWIALLNNDATAKQDWLETLAQATAENPDVDMFASRILTKDRPDVIDNTGLLMYPDGICRGRGRNEVDRGQFDTPGEVLFPSGCAGVYRHSMLLEQGGMDESFFCYCDDSDLGLACRIAGHRCLYVPSAIVYHAYSGSAGAYSELKAYLVERNRIWLVAKNFPLDMLITSLVYSFGRYLFQVFGLVGQRGAFAQFAQNNSPLAGARILLKAYLHALLGLPRMWSKRRRVWAHAALSGREVRRLIFRYRLTVRQIAYTD